jgi:hypothetical protein
MSGAAMAWAPSRSAAGTRARTASRPPVATSSASTSPLMTSTAAGNDVNQVMNRS